LKTQTHNLLRRALADTAGFPSLEKSSWGLLAPLGGHFPFISDFKSQISDLQVRVLL
jgi:hypothetical protein